MTLQELQILFPNATESTWHHHSNGGGWVENTARVDLSAYVGPNARVFGKCPGVWKCLGVWTCLGVWKCQCIWKCPSV